MSVNDRDLSALEHIAYRIREDTPGMKPWDREGCHIVFARELKGKHLLTALEIVTRQAADPEAKTPGAITRPFLPEAVAPPKPSLAKCPQHRDELAPPYCRIHNSEHIRAYHDEPVDQIPQETAREIARQAAADAAAAAKVTSDALNEAANR